MPQRRNRGLSSKSGDRPRLARSHLKMRKLLDDWLDGTCRKDLTTAEAFRLFEIHAKDRETAESCDIRLDQHRAATAKDVTPTTGVYASDRDHLASQRLLPKYPPLSLALRSVFMRIEVLGGVERRRRWSDDEKMRIIAETLATVP